MSKGYGTVRFPHLLSQPGLVITPVVILLEGLLVLVSVQIAKVGSTNTKWKRRKHTRICFNIFADDVELMKLSMKWEGLTSVY
ncbi:hypothetical protein MIMGU_mgv1a022911mg [Erythranthe guttata]|uniref:Uncharacterized protein n=1 Tax=Erythranthe guttata TaxID=4155 RepID=A0A022RME6_ERYGU|nr:hypothetical protein MIMGU_mgv1a022911mg [Erythranthe guttata]